MNTPQVVFSLLGPSLDKGSGPARWEYWRPSVALCQHSDFIVHRLELLHQARFTALAAQIKKDIAQISPETQVQLHTIEFSDPWDFEDVYAALHAFAQAYQYDTERENYLVHITTGTHVAQICLYLLTEARYFPGKLLQTSPPKRGDLESSGQNRIIDLDLSKYDRLASRFAQEQQQGLSTLKSGINTKNATFNQMIAQIEQVAMRSRAPILLTGPTGAGKSQLARRIYDLKLQRHQITGAFIEVNCATLRGDNAMSTLFGHKKGAFTGASHARDGLLKSAHQGMLFLDEIAELGNDEQAMLLRALEEKCFFPVGADAEIKSDFQLIAGTNRDLLAQVALGKFREDLLARINLWTYRLPGLYERKEDIEPNIEFELKKFAQQQGVLINFNKEARQRYLLFAQSPAALWKGNFRDLNSSITRMATLATGARISVSLVETEINRLLDSWNSSAPDPHQALLKKLCGEEYTNTIDLFSQSQLATVIATCRTSKSMAEAGRRLFSVSRQQRAKTNDSDRLRKYLQKYGLQWADIIDA